MLLGYIKSQTVFVCNDLSICVKLLLQIIRELTMMRWWWNANYFLGAKDCWELFSLPVAETSSATFLFFVGGQELRSSEANWISAVDIWQRFSDHRNQLTFYPTEPLEFITNPKSKTNRVSSRVQWRLLRGLGQEIVERNLKSAESLWQK